MDDSVHLAKFREGALAWNAWRAEYPGITPDLREIVPSLGEKQLGPAHGGPIDLTDALLNRANLHSATLMEARLFNADLRESNLAMALLAGADLSFANLSGAILDHADLRDANLQDALLEGARLDLARNLTQAQIDTALGDAWTSLPADLHAPESWRASERFTEEDLPGGYEEDDLEGMMPHEVLGLERDASPEAIRAAFLKLAKKYHPDVNPGDLRAERRFKTINQAHQSLTALEVKRPKRRSASPWPAAMALFIFAFAGPSLGLYWLGVGPFKSAPREEPQQAERSEKLPDRLADFSQHAAPPANTDYTGSLAASLPEAAASNGPAENAAPPSEPQTAMLHEAESQRINTASEVQFAMPPAVDERLTVAPSILGAAPDRIAPPTDRPSPPPERMAALQSASPTPAETGSAPWDDEWAALQSSNELQALHSFIQRYGERPAADEARGRFRTVVAALENTEPLQKFVRETVEDSPERAFVRRQLALLVEREAVEGDQKAWNETRDTGSIAALRAYLLGYPSGQHVDKAEERLAALEEEANGRKKDGAAWAKALRSATRAGYEAYLKAHPDGRNVENAERKIASLTAREAGVNKEEEVWAKASKERTRAAYFAYLNAYPNGRYVDAAQATIEKAAKPQQTELPRRAASEAPRPLRSAGPRFPSSDEPFVERMPAGR